MGLHNYLEKFKYSNALTEDLWEKLSEASMKPINELMELWTKQTGYPVVSVSAVAANLMTTSLQILNSTPVFPNSNPLFSKVERSVNADNHTILRLSQERFFSNGEVPSEADNYLWKIPITVVTKSSFPKIHQQILLEKRSDEVDLGVIDENDWVKLNDHSIGFYRTNYSTTMFEKLLDPIKQKLFHPTDRAGLQSDAFALVSCLFFTISSFIWSMSLTI